MAANILKSVLIGAALMTPALTGVAWAHGPTRQKTTQTVEIGAPPAKVWAIISNFHDLSWLPIVEKTTGDGGNVPDVARRHILLKGGADATIDEELYKYNPEKMTYSYRIEKVDVKVMPVNNYSSTIVVLPADGGKSTVEWEGAFYRGFPNNDPPPELSDDAAVAAVNKIYRAGLDNLKKLAEATH
jgi:hypothetical protein